MKKFLLVVAAAGLALCTFSPAFAIKQLNDQFKEQYAGEKATAEFKALVDEAKCNVCHVDKANKKEVRNPYGTALHEALEKDKFPLKEFKTDPAKYAERLGKILVELEKAKSADPAHETFGARMKANLLPGGDTSGK
jgi:tRNA nucleotidyltransferase/poly(A) polymerase